MDKKEKNSKNRKLYNFEEMQKFIDENIRKRYNKKITDLEAEITCLKQKLKQIQSLVKPGK